jgi:hypothetical protein
MWKTAGHAGVWTSGGNAVEKAAHDCGDTGSGAQVATRIFKLEENIRRCRGNCTGAIVNRRRGAGTTVHGELLPVCKGLWTGGG